ncbi:hypothetical protein [Lentibacillus cibarius]|uniref:Uncharacterized protein n=1 Tax=Lentibacillus cibarius TaxID=2583219 RepID=A0A5S3QIW1_9BACI|nr:hypothetical protein [Lentibacillus cibarius]TMN21862.1 hypothetical protein FFL34_06840 [Lentibacillus cibarius]
MEAAKNGSSVLVEFDKFDGNKATVVRTNDAEFAEGDYVLTISGLGDEDLTGEVTVEDRAVSEAVITNESLLDGTAKAKVGFELKDQYGDKVEFDNNDVTVSAFNKTQNKDVTIEYNSTDGFYVDTASDEDAFEKGDIVNVSLVDDETGLSASKGLEVVAGAQLDSITLGDVQLPEDKTLLTQDLEDVTVPYTAYDQYGNETELVKGDNVKVIVSDESILNPANVTFEKNSDGETYINVDSFEKAGKTNVILLNKVTGETTNLSLEVNEKAGVPYSVKLAEGSVDIPANVGQKVIDLEVTDKYGNKVEPKDYVGVAHTIAISNEDVVNKTNTKIEKDPTSENYGKLVVESKGTSEKGNTARITLTLNATGESAVLDVTVAEEATPFDLTVSDDSKHASSIVETGSTTVDFDVFDQYNNKLSSTPSGYTVDYKLSETDQSEFVSLSDEDNNLESAEVTVNGLAAGSATLVANLKDGSGEVVDTVEVPFTVVANSSEKFTYEVEDIPTLYKHGTDVASKTDQTLADGETGDNTYAKEIKVNAVDSDGSVVSIPASSIINVTESSDYVDVHKHSSNGKWYVAGSVDTDSDITEDQTVTLTLNVQTDEGTKTITKDVVVSAEDAEVVEFKGMDKAIASADTAKEKTSITSTDYVDTIDFSDAGLYLWTVDQFGVKANFDVTNADVVSATGFDGIKYTTDDTFTAGTDTVTVNDGTGDTVAEADSNYRLTLIENGVALDLGVNVTKSKAETVAPTVVSASQVDATHIKVTLSENIESSSIIADGTGFNVEDSATTPVNYNISAAAAGDNSDEIILTVEDYSGATGDIKVKFSTQLDKYEDAAGNDTATESTGVTFTPSF